jgi:hypothetical protein
MVNYIKRIILPALGITLFAIITCINASETYKWVDKDGVVHFSDHTPDDNESETDVIYEKESEAHKDSAVLLSTERTDSDKKNPIENTNKSTFTIKGSKNIGTGFYISPMDTPLHANMSLRQTVYILQYLTPRKSTL